MVEQQTWCIKNNLPFFKYFSFDLISNFKIVIYYDWSPYNVRSPACVS